MPDIASTGALLLSIEDDRDGIEGASAMPWSANGTGSGVMDVVQGASIVYSARATRWFLLGLVVMAVGTLSLGLLGSSPTLVFVGIGALAFVVLFAYAVRVRLRADQLALYREGDWLRGAALPRPFRAAETRFEVASDYDGGWVVVLTDSQGRARLAPGGWRLSDGGRMTRRTVTAVLAEMGLASR